jgi:hypothetical protein
MKKYYIKPVLLGMLFLFALLSGCEKQNEPVPVQERMQVRMNGTLSPVGLSAKSTRVTTIVGRVDPDAYGLPAEQLDVAIITVNYDTADPGTDQPGTADWSGQTADITRGFFGSMPGRTILNDNEKPTNGQIEYTNSEGTQVQRVFYDDLGSHYFIRVLYPYENTEFIQTVQGAAVVFYDLDGSQDIMSSNLGWGNIDAPVIQTGLNSIPNPDYNPSHPSNPYEPPFISSIVLSHMFSLLQFKVMPENVGVSPYYGEIEEIVIREQPTTVRMSMVDLSMTPHDDAEFIDFYALDLEPIDLESVLPGAPEDAGYLMVLPASSFRIEAYTTGRGWIGADFSFDNPTEPGKIYEITLKFMEAAEVIITATAVDEWWMDSELD